MTEIKKIVLVAISVSLFLIHPVKAQLQEKFSKEKIEIGETSFTYYKSITESESVVFLFHDWFGVSDLSYEVADLIQKKGMDVIIMDLYKGESATTNQEAQKLMNSIDQSNVWNYIDEVFEKEGRKYSNIFLWGFSLGTLPASQTAIKHNDKIAGLILFYGNVTQNPEQLSKINFPALMIMGSLDNPNGAISFFNAVKENSHTGQLVIYPKTKHAFAQKLFNGGTNYNEGVKAASFEVAFRFLSESKESC